LGQEVRFNYLGLHSSDFAVAQIFIVTCARLDVMMMMLDWEIVLHLSIYFVVFNDSSLLELLFISVYLFSSIFYIQSNAK
jgi:hypothetical protein